MSRRQITPQQQLNRLFCSPDFIRRVEASGKSSADVFLEATDEEVKRWLAEGGRLERRIHQKATGLYLLRELRGAFAGVTFVIAAILLAMLVSPSFRVAAGPETEWSIASHSFGWPAPALLFLVIFALPSVIAGPLVARLATNLLSLWIGLFCIALGCWWHIHLSTLGALVTRASLYGDGLASVERLDGNWFSRWFINAEFYMLVRGGMLFAIIEFLLPFICAIGAMLMMNYWVKCWRGGSTT